MNFFTVPASIIKSYINNGHLRSVNAKKNIIASFAIRGGSIAISIILLPITLHYINATEYGIWLTLTSIIGWFSFFDIGFGNGLRNKFTEAVSKGQHELARIYVSTTYAILTIIISIVLVVFFFINPLIDWAQILNASDVMIRELRLLALIVFAFFCIQFVLQLLTTILTANQQPAKASLFNFLGSLLSLLIIFFLTKTTKGNLIYLGAVFSFAPVFVLVVASFWCFLGEYRKYIPSIRYVKFAFAKDLMSLGLKFFIIQIAFVIFYQTSNIIIAQLFGPEEVTSYNVAYKYFGIIPMLFGIVLAPFWSAFTEAWHKNDKAWMESTMKRFKLLCVLVLVLAILMFIFSPIVYRIWVGKEVYVSLSVSAVMAAYVVINAWNGIHSNFLNGIGKVKLQLFISLIGSVINIPLAIFFGQNLGIYGVVLSTTIISLISAIFLPIQYHKIMHNKARGIWAN